MNSVLDRIRFSAERNLLVDLNARFDLDNIVSHVCDSDTVAAYRNVVIAQHVRLTPMIAPRLFRLLEKVQAAIGFEEAVDLYVTTGAEINAVAIHRGADDQPHVVSVTSELVRSMTDQELTFALGHELGHLYYRHYRVLMARAVLASRNEREEADRQQIPQLLDRRLDKWDRLAELSADRVGFVACGSDLHTAVSAFFKMASGLGPEHLRFDLDAFLAQLDRLRQLARREVMARFSHPVTPVRARALQLFGGAGASAASDASLVAVDEEISSIAALMDFEASSELASKARDFFVSAGLLAAHADGEPDAAELNVLMKLLLQVTGDPELHLEKIESVEQARSLLDEACGWLLQNSGQERFALFAQLSNLVAVDGRISDAERTLMASIAERLQIPEKSARETLNQVLAGHVQRSTTTTKKGFFGLGRGG